MSTRKIYKITNLVNNKIYIGKTIKELETRFHEHIVTAKRWAKEDLESRPHPYQSRLYPSMNKYGYDNFKIELVEELLDADQTTLESREQYWIAYYNTTDDTIGYNLSPGGLGGPLFSGHKQTESCKQACSKRFKGIKQSKELVEKRGRARARQMQSLDSGEVFSILDLPNGYFYKQQITNYRIYKSNNKFYACLESPHNHLPELSESDRQTILSELLATVNSRHLSQMTALQAGVRNRTAESKQKSSIAQKNKNAQIRKVQVETFLAEHQINIDEYIQTYLKYKDSCPNKQLELLYNISYSKVRYLNKYFNLSRGGHECKDGKTTIEENN